MIKFSKLEEIKLRLLNPPRYRLVNAINSMFDTLDCIEEMSKQSSSNEERNILNKKATQMAENSFAELDKKLEKEFHVSTFIEEWYNTDSIKEELDRAIAEHKSKHRRRYKHSKNYHIEHIVRIVRGETTH